MQKAMNFNDFAIVSVKGSDFKICYCIWAKMMHAIKNSDSGKFWS